MATMYKGIEGLVTLPAGVMGGAAGALHVNVWDGDFAHEVFDADEFGASPLNWIKKGHGRVDFKGTLSGWLDDAVTLNRGLATAINATAETSGFVLVSRQGTSTNASYTFSGAISNMRISVDRRGEATATLSWESSGLVEEVQHTD